MLTDRKIGSLSHFRPDGTPIHAVVTYIKSILNLLVEQPHQLVGVFFDSGKATVRTAIDSDYKAHRKPIDNVRRRQFTHTTCCLLLLFHATICLLHFFSHACYLLLLSIHFLFLGSQSAAPYCFRGNQITGSASD